MKNNPGSYVLATVAVIPGAVITIIGGAIFGSFFCIILVKKAPFTIPVPPK